MPAPLASSRRIARRASSYGTRGRLGLITPPTNTVNEAEWARMIPMGVTSHSHRMRLHADTTSPAGLQSLHDDLDAAIAMLAAADVDVVAYACTAGSMITPAAALPNDLTARNQIPVVTTAAAIIDALTALGATRISVATPYHDALNDHEAHFLADHGIEALSISGLGLGANGPAEYSLIAQTPLDQVMAHARRAFVHGSDALLLSCTDFPTLPIIPALEAELGVPVVSSNTATLFAALNAAGLTGEKITGAGRLLSGAFT
ncbi:maleate cis-trans isomerase [Pseudooceanicola sediminis]|uniref:Maleate cis-trans isomerase n=1 Tax=Pseudooceanicola sediminis TaxID=2211117 RepID=A0A399J4W2_9RHOB|nr:aspartate/glutamate racemase family protein [Pseudooceanicola sediminis]RII37886.1 maleate cis-trans isomerase [Pseudooceanicola sediminis]|tara:strand:- start:36472 stop:37254 length:783 start_codon:yes stop_codon:yes gene_type:complete